MAASAEVDFVIEKGRKLFAVELKATKQVHNRDFSGLRSFQEFVGKKCHPIIVYLGSHSQQADDIQILPFLDAVTLILK